MATPNGVGAKLSITPGSSGESTYGTYAAATRGLEFNSENLVYRKNVVQSMGLRGTGTQNLPLVARRVVTSSDAGGDFEVDMLDQGMGILLAHCMGSFPSAVANGTLNNYTFTLGDPGAKSFSCQVLTPDYAGTARYKTLMGCKVTQFELGVDNQGIVKLKPTIDAKKFDTTTSAATVAYVGGTPLHFAGAALELDFGSGYVTSTIVKDFTLNVDNSIKTDRYAVDGTGQKQAPKQSGFRKVTGKFTAEFGDADLRDAFVGETTCLMRLTVTGTNSQLLKVTMPTVRFNGDTPQVKGPDAIDLDVEFEVLYNGSSGSANEPLTILYTTADAAL